MDERQERIRKSTEEADQRAGRILLYAVNIEGSIEECIVAYFKLKGEWKHYDLHDLVIAPISFDRKKTLLCELCKKVGLEFSSEVISDISYIQNIRNQIAHRERGVDLDGKIVFRKRERITYSKDNIELNDKLMGRIETAFARIMGYLGQTWIELEKRERVSEPW